MVLAIPAADLNRSLNPISAPTFRDRHAVRSIILEGYTEHQLTALQRFSVARKMNSRPFYYYYYRHHRRARVAFHTRGTLFISTPPTLLPFTNHSILSLLSRYPCESFSFISSCCVYNYYYIIDL